MTDDIVTRLRMSADLMQGFPLMKAKHFNAEWVTEAADEIERLRADIRDLQKIIRYLKEDHND